MIYMGLCKTCTNSDVCNVKRKYPDTDLEICDEYSKETTYDRQRRWADIVYDDAFVGDCGLCECDEDLTIAADSEHVLCPVCSFCLKYHCGCEAL